MPNTKSAERRMRNNGRKHLHNQSVKSRLHTLEKKFQEIVASGKKEELAAAYRDLSSAFDKAAKSGVIHSRTASRKRSRLANRVNALPAAAPA